MRSASQKSTSCKQYHGTWRVKSRGTGWNPAEAWSGRAGCLNPSGAEEASEGSEGWRKDHDESGLGQVMINVSQAAFPRAGGTSPCGAPHCSEPWFQPSWSSGLSPQPSHHLQSVGNEEPQAHPRPTECKFVILQDS